MIGQYKFGKLVSYPHMKPEDVALWERFIAAQPDAFDTVDYDVKVGVGRMPMFRQADNIEKGWKDLTQKKIDVVAYKGNDVTIIEVKPNARANALGQIWMYDELYKADFKPEGKVLNMIITNDLDPDTLRVAATGDVTIIKV